MRQRQDLTEGLHVIRAAADWEEHWAGPSAERPTVDWQTEMCVVFALGTCSSGGFFALIHAIWVTGDRMRVMAWEIRPGNCAVTRGITHPLHAVVVPAHAGPVELSKRIAHQDCEAAR